MTAPARDVTHHPDRVPARLGGGVACAGALACLLLAAGPARADQVRNIRALNPTPIADRNGVLLLSLAAEQDGDRWPATMRLLLDDGCAVEGRVIWMLLDPVPRSEVHWTDDPRRLRVREVLPTDDSSTVTPGSALGPHLAVRLPGPMRGSMRLNQQTITPRWIDPPSGIGRFVADLPTLPAGPAPDLPDATSPFEYWRWVLLSHKLKVNTPRFAFSEVESMVADYFAALWFWGLERLRQADASLYAECVNALTRIARDRDRALAVWEAHPGRIGELLGTIVDARRDGPRLVEAVRLWLDESEPLLLWTESEHADHVRLAIVNTTSSEIVPRFAWIHTPDIPMAVPVPPGELLHVRIDRAVEPEPGPLAVNRPLEPRAHVLLVDYENRQFRMEFAPASIVARPPGVVFGPFRQPLTLGEIQMRQFAAVPAERATIAQFRRLDDRWEMFFECRRVPALAGSPPTALPGAAGQATPGARRLESVTLLLGDEASGGGPHVVLIVPETGAWRLERGLDDGTLEVHRRAYDDRWYCRIVIPDQWLLPTEGPATLIGCLRGHGDADQVETSPHSSVPWRAEPGRRALDLGGWSSRPPLAPLGERAGGS